MMTMRKASFILLLFCAFTVWSCQEVIIPGSEGSGSGSIELRLNSGNAISLQTKATDLEEGLEFNNVLAVLVNNSGNVVDKQYVAEASAVTQDIIQFDGLLPGNYQVYAYANIDATAWQKTGSETIANQEQTLTAGTPFSSFVNRELAALTGTDVPSDPSTSMLLTGHKEILVGLARVTDTLDLLRPVVRFKVTVRNHTDFPVTVDDLRFSSFNPDKAYLLDHLDASGVPSVPASVTYRDMPTFDTSAGDDNSVAANAEEVIYQRLMYENAYPGNYKIYTTLSLDRSSASMSTLQLSLGDHPFGLIDYATLNAMEKGDHASVLLINPRTATRSGRLYYGIGDTGIAWESCGYSSYNKFLLRALAIYNEEAVHTYDGFSYTGYGNDKSGLAGWTGNSIDQAYTGNTFNYTGARSRYFLSLTRHDSYFSIDGLSTNAPAQRSIPKVRLAAGVKDNSRFPGDLPVSYMVQFVNDDSSDPNYGKYLKSDNMWGANEANAKLCKVSWEDDGSSRHDHQFILFGTYQSGGPMKRILKENKKEVPLTYMARNEEINVIINVYYSDKSGELDFVVDNSTWKTATTSTHTFK
ncbi:MAG: FimB/Mfa2 family fimbrial subunit [Bacteroidales bacterium]|nr:FimB/Mfa2 family fimbrial subunit [Bacteroidales bacterium]